VSARISMATTARSAPRSSTRVAALLSAMAIAPQRSPYRVEVRSTRSTVTTRVASSAANAGHRVSAASIPLPPNAGPSQSPPSVSGAKSSTRARSWLSAADLSCRIYTCSRLSRLSTRSSGRGSVTL